MQDPFADDQLTQYRIVADHRLHFGRLFFQVTAFNLALALALFVVASDHVAAWQAMAMSGVLLLATAVVAGRLLAQERRYASAMAMIEAAREALLDVEPPLRRGARVMTVFGIAVTGLILTTPLLLQL